MNISYLNKDSFIINNALDIDAIFIFGYNNIDMPLINKINTYNCNTIIFNDYENSHNTTIHKVFNDDNFKDIKNEKLSDASFVTLNTKTIKNSYLSNLFNTDKYNRDIKFFNYMAVNNSNNTIIAYNNNNTFLNKYNIKGNDFYVFTSSLNLLDNNLPLKGSFIPLVYYLINQEMNIYYTYNTLANYNFNSISQTTLTIQNNINTYTADTNDNYKNFLNKPGFYSLYGTGKDKSTYISLNLNKDEFTTPLDNDKLEKLFPNIPILTNYKSFTKYISEMVNGIELWRYFLMLLIFLIITEMYKRK